MVISNQERLVDIFKSYRKDKQNNTRQRGDDLSDRTFSGVVRLKNRSQWIEKNE